MRHVIIANFTRYNVFKSLLNNTLLITIICIKVRKMKFKTVFFLNMNTITNKKSIIMLKKKQQRNRYRKKKSRKTQNNLSWQKDIRRFSKWVKQELFCEEPSITGNFLLEKLQKCFNNCWSLKKCYFIDCKSNFQSNQC